MIERLGRASNVLLSIVNQINIDFICLLTKIWNIVFLSAVFSKKYFSQKFNKILLKSSR